MSLTANISAAPELTLQPILVAGCLPVALLLAVELLARGPRSRQHTETVEAGPETGTATPMGVRASETDTERRRRE